MSSRRTTDSEKLLKLSRAAKALKNNSHFEDVIEMLHDRLDFLRELNDESSGIFVYRIQGAIGEIKRLIDILGNPDDVMKTVNETEKKRKAIENLGGIL